jgi:putative hydrolase of the HAD superfamily
MMTTMTTVLFDLGNVLLFFDHGKALRELAKHVNPLTAMLLWARKDEFLKDIRAEADLLETGRMTLEQFYSRLKGKIGLNLEFPQFQAIWDDIFTANEPVLALAQQLAMTYPCYILSNTNASHLAHAQAQFPQLGFARGYAASHELGVMKPAREFFDGALAKFALRAEECVFIDDLEENVLGARAVGLTAIQYRTPDALVTDLAACGVG